MNLADYGCDDIELMGGERIGRAISATGRRGGRLISRDESLILTGSRLIHVAGSGDGAEVMAASIDDVDTVGIVSVSEGFGAFVWAGLAVVLSVALYGVIDNSIARVAAMLAALAMGGYLVVNRLFFTDGTAAVFRTGGTAITWPFKSEDESREVREFIEEFYRMKSNRRRPFAPR